MKYTSKNLMNDMKLKVGDRVKFTIDDITYIGVVGFYDNVSSLILENKNTSKNKVNGIFTLNFIIHKEVEYEILPRPKKLGELKCEEIDCLECPLRAIKCGNIVTSGEKTLYQILGNFSKYQDQEIYDLLKKRLDEEVEE